MSAVVKTNTNRRRAALGAICLIPLFATSALAAPAHVTQVTLDDASSTATLHIATDSKVEYAVFRLNNPSRLVLDLSDVSGAVPKLPTAAGLINRLDSAQFDARGGTVTRFVVGVRENVQFETNATSSGVTLLVAQKGDTHRAAPLAVKATGITDVVELTGEGAAQKANRFLGVSAQSGSDGTIVAVKTNGTIARYEIEEVTDPPRIVIDLYGVSAKKDYRQSVDQDFVQRFRVGKHTGRTRIVLDARSALPRFDVASTSEGLTLIFDRDAEPRVVSAGSSLSDFNWQEKNGFYRLKLATDGEVRTRSLADGPRRKVIALEGTLAAKKLLGTHKYNHGPIDSIVIANNASSTTITMNLRDDVDHKVWQRVGAVNWDVRRAGRTQPRAAPQTVELANMARAGATAAAYRGRRITLDVMDADIVNILRLFSDISGRNFVIADNVEGKISVKLKNVPWDQALNVILRTKKLGKQVSGGIYRIALREDLDKEQAARLELAEKNRKQVPTTVRLIPVNYAVAKELTAQIEKLLSDRGKVTFDERTNVIIVEDILENLDQAERMVRTLDTQTPQVLIEARMVEASTRFVRSLGIQWGGGLLLSEGGGNPTGLVFPANVGIVGGADQVIGGTQAVQTPGILPPSNFAVNLPAAASNSAIGLNLGSIGNFGFLNARISAAETNNQAKLITSPKITTLNNKQAIIKQCKELGFLVNSAQGTGSLQTVTACIELRVRPHVTADGSVLMEVNFSNDTVDEATIVQGVPPTVDRKNAQTEMLVRDGDTAVIGGIYLRNYQEAFAETPFLSKIPILGWLFKNVRTSDARNELLVFLTPRIINRAASTISGR